MKLYLLSFFLLTGITAANAQVPDSLPASSELSIQDRVYAKGVDMEGHELRIRKTIQHVFLDSSNRYLYIKTENGLIGDLLFQYSLAEKRMRWSRNISFEEDELFYSGTQVFHNTSEGTSLIDTETGKDLLQTTDDGVAEAEMPNAFDLRRGREKWERKLVNRGKWNRPVSINDSITLISAFGIHVINSATGKGWDRDMTTTTRQYKGTMTVYSAPAAYGGGAFTTMSHRQTGPLITGLESNVMVGDRSLYMASMDEIVRLSYSGEKLWAQPLRAQLMSRSALCDQGENVLLVNRGYARGEKGLISYGQPLVAAYSKVSGKLVFETLLEESPIQDFGVKENTMYILTKDNIAQLSLTTGYVMQNIKFPNGVKLISLVDSKRFVKEHDNYKPISSTDTSALFVETNQGIYKLTNNLTAAQIIPMHTTYRLQAEAGDKKLINADGKTLLIDGEKVIADLGNLKNPVMIGNTIYDVSAGTIIQYDVKYP